MKNKNKINIFDGMSNADVALILTYVNFKSFRKGNIVIKENDATKVMYFILSGECDVLVSNTVVGKLTPNTMFGEISELSTGVRGATVVATKDLQAIELLIDYDKFDKYTVPFAYFYRNVVISLIQKITETNTKK